MPWPPTTDHRPSA